MKTSVDWVFSTNESISCVVPLTKGVQIHVCVAVGIPLKMKTVVHSDFNRVQQSGSLTVQILTLFYVQDQKEGNKRLQCFSLPNNLFL